MVLLRRFTSDQDATLPDIVLRKLLAGITSFDLPQALFVSLSSRSLRIRATFIRILFAVKG